jgi:hypothetical protein
VAPTDDNAQYPELSQADFQALLHEKERRAVRFTLTTVLDAEVEAFVQAARYQRTARRRDSRFNFRPISSIDIRPN